MKKYSSLSDNLMEEIWERSYLKTFKKNEVIRSAGKRSNVLFFVVEGFCVCYYCKDGRESVLRFIGEGESYLSLHGGKIYETDFFHVKAAKKTTLLCLNRNDYDYLWDNYPDFVFLVYNMLEQLAAKNEYHYYRLRSYSAEERIRIALENREIQSLIQHVPQYNIASYLNMAPETFAKLIGILNKNG